MIVPVTFLGTGLFIAFLGALIRDGGSHSLIAGFDAEHVEDPEGLGAFVGTALLVVAGVTIFTGVVAPVLSLEESLWYWVGYVAVVCALAVWMVHGSRQYQ